MAGRNHGVMAAVVVAAVGAVLALSPTPARGGGDPLLTVSLHTATAGNTQWDYLDGAARGIPVAPALVSHIATRPGRYCRWSHWRLRRVNLVTGARDYAIYIYDACAGGRQIFPGTQCTNDSSQINHQSDLPSDCETIPPHHVPAGLAGSRDCGASAVTSASLDTTLSPPTYDAAQATNLTVSASFAGDISQRISEGTCTDVLDWRVTGWSFRWPDGAVDTIAGAGQSGVSRAHRLAPSPGRPAATPAVVAVTAHLHVQGTFQDFDAAGDLVTVHREADVDISNQGSAGAEAVGAIYTPPVLAVAAVGIAQRGDGTIAPLNPAALPTRHLDAFRGRLLDVYPRVLVLQPGSESIGGVTVGTAATSTTSWIYRGGATDAPAAEATPAGSGGDVGTSLAVQWNHLELLDGGGRPVDEIIPVGLAAETVFPDGHTESEAVTGDIAATIWYVALGADPHG